jgi:FkbM family methyltransferase
MSRARVLVEGRDPTLATTMSNAHHFRARSLAERLAEAMPSAGPFGAIRRLLKPLFERLITPAGGGIRCELPGGEGILIAPAFRHITWNPEEYSAFRAAVRSGDVVVEAGANVGAYTTLFGKWVGPSGRVFAFEPDPVACDGLRRHVALNGLGDIVTVVPAAVSDGRAPRLRFRLFASSGISRVAGVGEEPGGSVQEVDATSIDRFCAERRVLPSVMKIDVEGAELGVLQGARETIARAGPNLHTFVEMHPQLWPALRISAEDISRECASQGLVAEQLDGSTDRLWTTEGVCLRLRRSGA